jgi:hypothetical protein
MMSPKVIGNVQRLTVRMHVCEILQSPEASKLRTSTYCKNFDVLFAALWTKLTILSKNRGNLKKKNPYCPITSLLPR